MLQEVKQKRNRLSAWKADAKVKLEAMKAVSGALDGEHTGAEEVKVAQQLAPVQDNEVSFQTACTFWLMCRWQHVNLMAMLFLLVYRNLFMRCADNNIEFRIGR